MTCRSCGAELPVDARFCHACGTAVGEDAPTEVVPAAQAEHDLQAEEHSRAQEDGGSLTELPIDGQSSVAPVEVDMPLVDASDPVDAPPVGLPQDQTQTGVAGGVLHAQVPTPSRQPRRPRTQLEERGAWSEFVRAAAPLATAPRFTGGLLAALVAFAFSVAAAALVLSVVDRSSPLLLAGLVDTDSEPVGVHALLTLVMHQVPLLNDGDMWHDAPLLLAIVPLLGCALGALVARRVLPCSGRGERLLGRALAFALLYGLLLFVWSLFDAAGWNAAHLRSLLAGIVFAIAGTWLAERWLARRHGTAVAERPADATELRRGAPARASRLVAAVRTATRVLALTLLVGAVAWLAGSLVEALVRDDDRGVGEALLHVGEGGFRALGFGVLAEGEPLGAGHAHDTRIYESAHLLSDPGYVLLLLASTLPVLVGGLFSGFAVARRVRPGSRNAHAAFGALTGPVWATGMLLAQFLVLVRLRLDRTTLTALDGDQAVLLSLLAGSVLGALGGLLAATAGGASLSRARAGGSRRSGSTRSESGATA